MQKINIDLDFGKAKDEAFRYYMNNQDVLFSELINCYEVWGRKKLPGVYMNQPLKNFMITPVNIPPGERVRASPKRDHECEPAGDLRMKLDELYEEDEARATEPVAHPERIRDNEAVQIAYRHDLQAIARFLENDLSVLIMCDKMLTEHIYEYVCKLGGKTPVLDDAAPEGRGGGGAREAFDQGMKEGGGGIETTLPLLIRNLKTNQILVIRGVDVLDNPALIETLYQGGSGDKKPQLLGFLDPSLEVKKVLSNRFAVHASIMGLPRYIQPDPDKPRMHTVSRLITARENKCFKKLDPEGVYKNVSGLNAIQFRNAMRYVGATVAEGARSRHIYNVIRQFKTSSSDEIEIPDTTFDDIGGYERVKGDLLRIIALVAGRVPGISEREREKLIPRGFVFHGGPGTGKTLFAKAIANEMNATIQMVSGPEVMDKYVGQSESNIRKIFATARRNAPSVIFFDEFDSIAGQRGSHGSGGERANNAVVAQLLTELDGFRQDQTVLVIGTTNRIDIIDEALLRPSRMRPIEIGDPDFAARQQVARIHARSFGVDALLTGLCKLTKEHLSEWKKKGRIPEAFLEDLFALHPPHKARYKVDAQKEGFKRDLTTFFNFFQEAGIEPEPAPEEPDPLSPGLETRLIQIARTYGLDLTRPDPSDQPPGADETHETIQNDIRDIFELLKRHTRGDGASTPDAILDGVINLIAEYTEGFNNDEIRAIFQEASLEHHLEGSLITPRYLGMKIGLIKKRRDERDVTHLSGQRGRR